MELPQQILSLIEKYLDGRATTEEKQQLNDWYRQKMQDTVFVASPEDNAEAKTEERLRRRLQQTWQQMQPAPVKKMKVYRRLAVAASILLVIGLTAVLSLIRFRDKNNPPSITTTSTPTSDVAAPASTRAVITLANGKTIALDSVANGTLAMQGTTNIVKTASGEIIYKDVTPTQQNITPVIHTLTNPKGSKVVSLTLQDGTKVWLNTGSSLHFPAVFTGSERVVEITGEAYFEVAHLTSLRTGAKLPFIVKKTGTNTSVEVLGTHFNMNAYDEEDALQVTLLEGSVRITDSYKKVQIRPGQQAQVTATGMEVNNQPDLEKIMAWKNNEFIFENDDIKSIMKELARWYNIEVVYDKDIPAKKYTGRINRTVPLSQVLDMFERVGYIHFAINGQQLTILPAKK